MISVDEMNPVVKNFRAARAELRALQDQLGKTMSDIDSKTQALVAIRQRSQADRLSVEAQAMLSSGGGSASELELSEEINNLEHRRQVTETAIEMQKQVVDRVRGPYAIMLNEAQQARHEEIVERLAKGVLEVARAFDDEIRLFDELTDADAGVRMRPMRLNAVGSLRDQSSVATGFIREVKTYFPEIKV